MMEFGHLGWLGAAFALGALLGSLFTKRIALLRLDANLHSAAAELNKRHAAETTELRAAHLRAQRELEQVRASFKHQLVAAAEGPRAAAQRAEERLQLAYRRTRPPARRVRLNTPVRPDGAVRV